MAPTKAETLFFSSMFFDYWAALPALNREFAKRTRDIRGGRRLGRSKRALALRQGSQFRSCCSPSLGVLLNLHRGHLYFRLAGSNQPLPRSILMETAYSLGLAQANAPGFFQPFPQFTARTPHTGLHCARRDLQDIGGLAGGELLNRSQQKDNAISGTQSLHGLLQQFSQLFAGVSCLGAFYGRLELLGSSAFLGGLNRLFERHVGGAATLAQAHQRLINGDPRNPCRQARPALELTELAVHFEQRLLLPMFGIFGIARNAYCQSIYTLL